MISFKSKKIAIVLIVNIVILSMLFVGFLIYNNSYRDELKQQNINEIKSINQSSSYLAASFLSVESNRLDDISHFIENRSLNYQQSIDYIFDSAAEKQNFQILNEMGTGFAIQKEDGNYVPLDYNRKDYSVLLETYKNLKDYNKVSFMSEFSDQLTGEKCFGLFIKLKIENKPYCLMMVMSSSNFSEMITIENPYVDLSCVLINVKGDYIFKDNQFKSDSFYEYLTLYNDLRLEEKNVIKNAVLKNSNGELYYKNSINQDCIYAFNVIKDTQWYTITCVPISSFRYANYDVRFSIFVLFMMALLFVIDFKYMSSMNKQFKHMAKEAKSANNAKTEFLSQMSHDIRTPLNVIQGMAALAQNESHNEECGEYLENIESSCQFLTGLVNDILDLNKVESGKIELNLKPYQFTELQHYLNAVIKPLCEEKSITFEYISSITNEVYLVDSVRLNQVFFNILSNSVKFTDDNGKVWVHIQKSDEGDYDHLHVECGDNGIGMSHEFQKIMFNPFERENRVEKQGTGLGLSIVKRFVEIMDGKMIVRSDIGLGTIFIIDFDIEKTKEVIVGLQDNIDEAVFVDKRILLCEDHPLNAKIAMKLLENKGFIVEWKKNGEEGVEAVRQQSYDAVLMDIRMPVMDGLTASKAIREFNQKIPIIAMTANAYDEDVNRSFEAGMNAHIAKPIDQEQLFRTIYRFIKENEV